MDIEILYAYRTFLKEEGKLHAICLHYGRTYFYKRKCSFCLPGDLR